MKPVLLYQSILIFDVLPLDQFWQVLQYIMKQ
jgi:hypothetical protein